MGVKNLHAAVSEGGYDKLGVNLFTYPLRIRSESAEDQ